MKSKQKAILEAVLFASGSSVPIKRLCDVMSISADEMDELLNSLSADYEEKGRGIRLIRLEDNCQLCTKEEYYDSVHLLNEKNRRASLTNAGLEVLSIVAYNQPVTRSTIEFIRGVNSDGALNNLIAAGFVQEAGRLDAPGRPILFETTEEFLRSFNLSSLSELPEIDAEYGLGASEQTGSDKKSVQIDAGEENAQIVSSDEKVRADSHDEYAKTNSSEKDARTID